jgi:large subunit ribosomal protein L23
MMNQNQSHRLLQIIISPVVSEKATHVNAENAQYVFKVMKCATKHEIKLALELLFKVNVVAVNVVNRKGKEKRFGKHMGRRDHRRFAYISLQEGQVLNMENAEIK